MELEKEMISAGNDLSEFLANQPKTASYFTTNVDYGAKTISRDSPRLSEDAMTKELSDNVHLRDTSARDFYTFTRNSDTAYSFLGQYASMNTGFYRAQYQRSDDPLAQSQVQTANDCSYRAMHEAHKNELAKAEPEALKSLELQHAFEKNHFDYSEKRDSTTGTLEEEQVARQEMLKSFKAYKADSLGYDGVDRVFKNGDTKMKVTEHKPEVVKPEPTEAMKKIHERMLAMRPKEQTQGRSL